MANLNIKLNAYFTPNLPERMLNAYDESSEALWITNQNVLEYISSVGVEKESYIGLIDGEHLYVKPSGKIDGQGILYDIVLATDGLSYSYIKDIEIHRKIKKGEKREDEVVTAMKKVFDVAKEIYLQSEISKDKAQLYQFSEEDTLMLLEKIFGHHKSIKLSK